jgi:hypothetical protein
VVDVLNFNLILKGVQTMRKLKQYSVIALVLTLIFLLSACGNTFKYDKDEAIKSAQNFIEVVNTKDYTAAVNLLPENLKSQISAEKLQDAWDPPLTEAGSFIEYENGTTTGVTQNDINYIIVVVPCKYENSTLTFTITYTTDLKIAALELN